MRHLKVFAAMASIVLFATAAAAAEGKNILRGGFQFSSPSGDLTIPDATYYQFTKPDDRLPTNLDLSMLDDIVYEADNATGGWIAYERKITDLIGVNFDISVARYDVTVKGGDTNGTFGTQKAIPLTLTALFHPLRTKRLDLYAGAGLSHVRYDNFRIETKYHRLYTKTLIKPDNPDDPVSSQIDTVFSQDRFRSANDLTWAVQAGLDIKLTPVLGLNIDAKYIKSAVEWENFGHTTESLDINPLNIGFGCAVRF
jgi:outer membrane protein W